MSKINAAELEAALIDVRKAYRLLYSYQRRVMDTIKFIGDTISRSVHSGWAVYSDNPPKDGGKLQLNRWAWDWLNMYAYEYHFGETEVGQDKINFAIMVQSDTGAYELGRGRIGTEIDLFASPEESVSRVIFQLGQNRWKAEDYHRSNFFSSNALRVLEQKDHTDRFFIAKTYPLTDVMDEDGILATLRDFIGFAREAGLTGYFDESTLIRN